MVDKPPRLVPNIQRLVIARIETLEQAALDPDHGERARVTAQELIGNVRVIEESEHIIAEIDGGRRVMPSAALDVTLGAQERT